MTDPHACQRKPWSSSPWFYPPLGSNESPDLRRMIGILTGPGAARVQDSHRKTGERRRRVWCVFRDARSRRSSSPHPGGSYREGGAEPITADVTWRAPLPSSPTTGAGPSAGRAERWREREREREREIERERQRERERVIDRLAGNRSSNARPGER